MVMQKFVEEDKIMDKKYQIFVSSTYMDLKNERQVAINAIMKLRQIPAGMELFSATGENQFEMIKPIIFESDYYLLIVAGKYGSVCRDTGLSYTEMEYDFAVQNHKRIIAFVHDDPDNLPSNDREITDKMRKKLKKFRKKVMENKMVKVWHDKTDLFQSIPISISTVMEMYPSNTCWIHVNENDIYTPIGNYVALKDQLDIQIRDNMGLYYQNLEKEVLQVDEEDTDTLCLIVDIPERKSDKITDEYAGCNIRMSSDSRDWARYVLNNYCLTIDYSLSADESVSMWVEIKNHMVEMYKQMFRLEIGEGKQISICLKEFLEDIDDWKKVKEVCFVFRPIENRVVGTLSVSSVRLER